jgi:hypothetical protein
VYDQFPAHSFANQKNKTMPAVFMFVKSDGEFLTLGEVDRCCDEFEKHTDGEKYDPKRHLTMYDCLEWIAIKGQTTKDCKAELLNQKIDGKRVDNSRMINMIEWLEDKLDLVSFSPLETVTKGKKKGTKRPKSRGTVLRVHKSML